MSHQTGIKANEDLKQFFAKCKDGSIRMIKVGIDSEKEELCYLAHKEPVGTWEEDYDDAVLSQCEEEMPCYILYRLDSTNSQGYQWVFISYSPDFSVVRYKMLYAGTRATLKKEFGGGHLKEELFGTVKSDVSLQGFKKHLEAAKAPPPLTMRELELEEVKQAEGHRDISIDSKHSHMSGIHFPISKEAMIKLEQLKNHEISYVQLSLDTEKEEINLEKAEAEVLPNDLSKHIPTETGRFNFYLFKHTHEGDYMESIMFIYSIPGYQAGIKERMLYSSCKGPVIMQAEEIVGMEILKKIEVSDPADITEEFLQEELHPKKILHRPKFAKPKGPAGRSGGRRIVKN